MVPMDVIREIFRKIFFYPRKSTRKQQTMFFAGKYDGDFAVLIPEEGTVDPNWPIMVPTVHNR